MAPVLTGWFVQKPRNPSGLQSPYRYCELESPSHTRLIELLPAKDTAKSPLRCKIHHVNLSHSVVHYTALSYAWGKPSVRPTSIECNGGKAFITPNLASALLRLRLESESRMLWVDALSIQQGEDSDALKEKNYQIRMMSKIFRGAHETVVDLEARGTEDTIVIQAVKKYMAIDETNWKAICDQVDNNFYHEPWRKPETTANVFQEHDLPKLPGRFWQAFGKFLSRPWFSRLWVVQEFAISKNVKIMIGNNLVEEDFLTKGCQRALYHYIYMACRLRASRTSYSAINFLVLIPGLSGIVARETGVSELVTSLNLSNHFNNTLGLMARASFTWRSIIQPDGQMKRQKAVEAGMNFCMMFFKTLQFQVTDDRDRVYAILGMVGDGESADLHVDYQEAAEQLSIRVSYYLIQRQYGAWPLLYRCEGASSTSPSWSVKLKSSGPDKFTYLLFDQARISIFQSGGVPKLLPLKPTDKPEVLVAEAISLGQVMFQTEPALVDLAATMLSMDPSWTQRALGKSLDIWMWLVKAFEWTRTMAEILEPDDVFSLQSEDFETSCYKTLFLDLCSDDEAAGSAKTVRLAASPRGAGLVTMMRELGAALEGGMSARELVLKIIKERKELSDMLENLQFVLGRRLGVVNSGPCLLPAQAQVDDEVVVLLGYPLPFVVRAAEDGTYRIVGTCYAHGMMDGQALELFGSHTKEILLS